MRLTHKYLTSILAYSPEEGSFTWLVSVGSVRAGRQAGGISAGYIQIRINKKFHKAHRLAWFYMTGKWPLGRLDHEDGNTANNRWSNLRRATHSQNMANRKLNRNNTSGFKGVSRRGDSFRAYVNKNGKRVGLGTFPTAELAHAAYTEKARELHGEFARAA